MSIAPTTQISYVNRNGQVTIRNTQQASSASAHQEYGYQLACSQCGYKYGLNIFDRKCPECQGGRRG